jgi:hypothetical protein
MSKQRPEIDDDLKEWISRQKVFFVATAPLSPEGHINISPKGGDAFRVLGPLEAAYHDYTGSGIETAAHLRENGRIITMFCGFEGNPRIARLHGHGTLIQPGDARFQEFQAMFPPNPGTRLFVHIQISRVSTSCGFSVPFFDYQGERKELTEWAVKHSPEGLKEYWGRKNRQSIDGLPGLV